MPVVQTRALPEVSVSREVLGEGEFHRHTGGHQGGARLSLFGGVEIPGHPDLENLRKLDLLPVAMIRSARRIGIGVDREYFHALTSRFSAEMRGLEKDISSYVPSERLHEFAGAGQDEEDGGDGEDPAFWAGAFNAGSPEQVGKLMFDMLGIGEGRRLKRTEKGGVSTGKKQLETLRLDHPVVPLVLRFRQLNTLITRYTAALPKLARLHPRGVECPVCELPHKAECWRVHGEMGTTRADTGRINHKNPNLSTIPVRSADGRDVQAGFIAPEGMRLVTRDLSQIELRDLAHLAHAGSMIRIYQAGGDIHDHTARKIFKLAEEVKPDKYNHRLPAKRCIAKGQRVLTSRGLIPIEAVTGCDLVWDGVEWVSHDGVVYQGRRKVITYDGLSATPDHEVWTASSEKASLGEVHRRGIRIAVTGDQETPIRLTDRHQRENTQDSNGLLSRLRCLCALQKTTRDAGQQYRTWRGIGLQMLQQFAIRRPPRQRPVVPVLCDQTTLHKSATPGLSQLRRARYQEFVQIRRSLCALRSALPATSHLQRARHRTHKQRRRLRTWELATGEPKQQRTQQAEQQVDTVHRREDHRGGSTQASTSRLSKLQARSTMDGCPGAQRVVLAGNTEQGHEVDVYDILNAGPRHRFTVENKLVFNCNFSIVNGTTEKGLYLQLVLDYGENRQPVPSWLTENWCDNFIVDWLDIYPEVREFFDLAHYRVRRYGMNWEPFGRVKLIPEVKSTHAWIRESGLRQAQNFPVTSLAATQLKLCMGAVEEMLERVRAAGVWAWALLSIHDAILEEVEEDAAEGVLEATGVEMDGCMRDRETGEWRFRVPVESDGEVMWDGTTQISRWKKAG